MKRIVVDAMGGDYAPDEIVKGALEAAGTLPETSITLVGDAGRVERILNAQQRPVGRIHIHHAGDVIGMDESPKTALERKPRASIVEAVDLVSRGEGDALVSAGNTGACVLACANGWRLTPGVERAGFAAVFPTELRHGKRQDPFSLILDVGATVDASAHDLVSFALMGAAYSRIISQNERPRVALLSNGTESTKGPPEVVGAHALLTELPCINFIGNVEGLDIPRGHADVIVCSGYVGNVVIKMLEGVAGTVVDLARYAYKERLLWRAGLAMLSGGIRRLKEVTDWRQYGGAPLLGFDNLCIKAHGRSTSRAVANAVRVADKALTSDLHGLITQFIGEFRAMDQASESPLVGIKPS